MTIKELKDCRHIQLQISYLQERIATLRSAMESYTRQLNALPSGTPQHDKICAKLALVDELERKRGDAIIDAEIKAKNVESWIDSLPAHQAVIMRLRYVVGLKWDEIAEKIHYSRQHCTKLHKMILSKLSVSSR